jgi:peptidoglycan/LPS O-acetylase OafA/YrhL
VAEQTQSTVASGPTSGTRRRLDHIDAMRPVKQAAVVSTHALIFFAPLATSSTVVGLIMLTRFSRDAFLFVSACMLTYSYRDAARVELGRYAWRRFLAVGVPYLTWTVIYYFFTSAAATSSFPFYTFHGTGVLSSTGATHFIHLLWTGYYQLYYLIVIMEFYVIFPLLMAGLRRAARWHWAIIIAAVVLQLAYGVLISVHPFGFHLSGTVQTRLIISYPAYLVGGVIVALHLDDVHRWIVDHAHTILLSTAASIVVIELASYLGRYSAWPSYLRTGSQVFAPLLVPYNMGMILCVYLLGVHLVSTRRSERTRAAVQSGSDNSYGVYLSQMIWIPLLVRLVQAAHWHVPWPVAVPAALVIVYGTGFVFTAVMARTPLAKGLTGRSRAPWSTLWPGPRRPGRFALRSGDAGSGPMDVVSE